MTARIALDGLLPMLAFAATAANAPRTDHVRLALPDYSTGEECLFCHRDDVGPAWSKTSHAWTTRAVSEPPAVGKLADDATNASLARLGKKQIAAPRLKQAVCAQCHLRGAKSLSGRSHPNNFFAGDDLFADFQVDLDNVTRLDKNDTYSYAKTRAVLDGESDRTCLECHKIHIAPTERERDPTLHSAICGC